MSEPALATSDTAVEKSSLPTFVLFYDEWISGGGWADSHTRRQSYRFEAESEESARLIAEEKVQELRKAERFSSVSSFELMQEIKWEAPPKTYDH